MDARVDPRVARSRACIVAAASAALQEHGAAGVTMEGVAERAGVAKTTVYRLWSDRSELLLAAFEQLAEQPSIDDTGDLRADLGAHLRSFAAALDREAWPRSLPALVDLSERDPRVAELAIELGVRRRRHLEQRLVDAVGRGELPADTDIGFLVSVLVGPLFHRRYFSRQTTSDEQIARLVDMALAGGERPG